MPFGIDEHTFDHRSVMVGEIVAAFEPVPAGVVVDATVGGGDTARRSSKLGPT